MPGDGIEPPTRGFSIQTKNQVKQGIYVSKAPETYQEPNAKVSKANAKIKETPAALAGATGAISNEQGFRTELYRKRAIASSALCLAIAECDPDDACQIMSAALADLSRGAPLPVFVSALDDARWWASISAPHEVKAFALACFEVMRPKVQAAFLAHVQRGAAI